MIKKYWAALGLAVCSLPVYADSEQTAQQLRFQTQQLLQQREQAALVPEPEAGVLRINGEDFAVGNNAAELAVALMVAVNHRQADDVARLLQRYRALPEYDAATADFAEAALSRLRGDLAQAQRQYQALLAAQPEFTRARLDWARLLFDNREDKAAQAQFAQLADAKLPPAVRKNVQGYRDALDVRNGWHLSVSAGPVWNSNVGEGTGKSETFILHTPAGVPLEYEQSSPPPQPARGIGYDAALSKRWPLAGHHALWLRGLLYGTHYRHHAGRSEDTLNLAAGYQWASAQHSWSAAPLWEWNQTGNRSLYRAAGARAEWQYSPRPDWGVNIEAERKHMQYAEDYRHNNGKHSSVYATLSYAPNPRWWLYGGADMQWRQTQEPANDYRQYGLRAGVVRQWGDNVALNLNAAVRRRQYAAFNPWLQVRRRDREQVYSATLTVPRWQLGGFTPALTLKHTRVSSNAGWFAAYRKNEALLKWSRFF
ncbi:surface lipoprotein assembly modifier [Uruburuella testudinis]|uniref:Surface lipoprotein assembly modifier n=1 Tax=Uruburuella testudinis TaxID=1282863 RepID=A0ABY4DQC3_9NEIS|nr:surface lipoprotein assembly modifier [Uruburuella testudinis]UOO80939.1 surface lipoprotein assembly modifier [Uruburuella testudinis]